MVEVAIRGRVDLTARVQVPAKFTFAFPVAAGPIEKGVRRNVDCYARFAFGAVAPVAFPAGGRYVG